MTTVTICGAGRMGHALALVHALGGCEVRLHDQSPDALAAARDAITRSFETLRDAHGTTETALPAIAMTTDLGEAARGTDLFVEAATEDMAIKHAIFAEADRCCPDDAILTSTTSMLDVLPCIPQRRLERFCVVHWYSPPYIIDLVEIAPGERTESTTTDWLRDLYAGMGKRPVVFDRFFPGYVANRVQSAITREIMGILDEGLATAAQIDDSLRYGVALRMAVLGHLMRSDFAGLKLVESNLTTMTEPGEVPATTLRRLVMEGHDGVASGRGFYDYAGRTAQQLYRERDSKLVALARAFDAIGPVDAAN